MPKVKTSVRIVGWISFVFGLIGIVGFVIPILLGSIPLGSPVIWLIQEFFYFYVAYTILYKKKGLSKWEWVAVGIFFALFIIQFSVGFLIGANLV